MDKTYAKSGNYIYSEAVGAVRKPHLPGNCVSPTSLQHQQDSGVNAIPLFRYAALSRRKPPFPIAQSRTETP